jgi:hypothetical protein
MRRVASVAIAIGAMLSLPGMAIAADQPHMYAALQALQNALHEIEIADQARDHGGHAGAATNLTQQAIHEVQEGIAFRDRHGP